MLFELNTKTDGFKFGNYFSRSFSLFCRFAQVFISVRVVSLEAYKSGKVDGLTYRGGGVGVGAGGRGVGRRKKRSRSRKEEMEEEEDLEDCPPERLYTNDSTLYNTTLHYTTLDRAGQDSHETGRVDPDASIFSYLL